MRTRLQILLFAGLLYKKLSAFGTGPVSKDGNLLESKTKTEPGIIPDYETQIYSTLINVTSIITEVTKYIDTSMYSISAR